jgi:hypothetical protein
VKDEREAEDNPDEEGAQMKLSPIQITMEEINDPAELARFRVQWEQSERNSAWLQAHAHEIYTQHRGKFIVVAGEELFVGDTPAEAHALAKAAHPEDKGSLSRYIYPKKMARIYAHQR